jgi:hypothetical protein
MADDDWEEEFESFIYQANEYLNSNLPYDEELAFRSEFFHVLIESFDMVHNVEGNKRACEMLKENSFIGLEMYDAYFFKLVEPLQKIVEAKYPNNKLANKRKLLSSLSFKETIRFCGYFFPKKFREEAKGDITETRQEMLGSGCSKLIVNLVSSFKIICFILSSLRIRWSDFVDSEKERNR